MITGLMLSLDQNEGPGVHHLTMSYLCQRCGKGNHAQKSSLYVASLKLETFGTKVQCFNHRPPYPCMLAGAV
jgi:DNA-directed RNA polymerase subunit RPC12/RpoP